MKKVYFVVLYALLFTFHLSAQETLDGTWQGKFEGDYMASEIS